MQPRTTLTRPKLSAPIPQGWAHKESITILHPEGRGNIIFSSEPVSPETTTDVYAAKQGELLSQEFPGYRELSLVPMTVLGGRSGWFRRFEWDPPEGARVRQMQIYCAEDGRGYSATATLPLGDPDHSELESLLSEILAGLDLAVEREKAKTR